jgi:DNA-binding SARP family transcriptional activator
MFGRLRVHRSGESIEDSIPKKARELLAHLLLRRRAHPREKLATLLWPHGTTQRAKAYLRKALWQLRQSLNADDADADSVLRVEGDWVQACPEDDVDVDVVAFEDAFEAVQDCSPSEMSTLQVQEMKNAVSLYTGDLLENWYQEWCLTERERLRDMFLRMLDRLIRRCEQDEAYDSGIKYGMRALRIDPARERVHRHLMRLRARAGDRIGALRQYERCADVLEQELGVAPSTATQCLHERIQEDQFPEPTEAGADASESESSIRQAGGIDESETVRASDPPADPDVQHLREGVERMRQLQSTLAAVQQQIRRDVETVEVVLQEREG